MLAFCEPGVHAMCPSLFSSLACAAAAWAGCATVSAQSATPLADFSSGPGNGLYSYASTTPASVSDLVQRERPRPGATAQAELVLPANTAADARLPAVVLVHGSGGVYPELVSFWAARFNAQGIVAFVIDVFGPRGVKSTGEDQSQVPFAADTADAFAALRMLASHPRIDAKRIAVMGFSRGGITAIRSAAQRIVAGSASPGTRFAAHVGAYPGGCTGSLALTAKPGVFGPAPMLFVHGEADDYTYAVDCKDYAARIGAAGTPTEFVMLPGARHKFDVDNPQRINVRNNPKAKLGCPLEFDIVDMTMRDRRSGEALSGDRAKSLGGELCADKGATLEGDRKARDIAAKAVLEFLNKVLKA
jgi:dienelactone hydrolase